MNIKLNRGSRSFVLSLGARVNDAVGEPIRFLDAASAAGFLRGFSPDASMGALRRLFAAGSQAPAATRLRDSEILAAIARWIASGKVTAFEVRAGLTAVAVEPTDEAKSERKSDELFEKPKTWIEIVLVDMQDKPVPGVKYAITIPEGVVIEGRLDAKGRARVDNIDPGTCEVRFPELDAEAWTPA